MTIVLGSQSLRRKEFFHLLGLNFATDAADVDEAENHADDPAQTVCRLSQIKARAVAARHPQALVVGADTVVALDGEVLGKPADGADAVVMLRRLRNRVHFVYSAVTVIHPERGEVTEWAETTVRMRDYTEAEIRAYVASGDPMDKAGAYAIQNPSFHPVEDITGCYASVMGLPLCHLARAFWRLGEPLAVHVPRLCRAHTGFDCTIYGDFWPGLPEVPAA